MSTNRNTAGPIRDGDEFDWLWVGEPEAWMGLRSERAMTHRPGPGIAAAEPQAGRLAFRLVRTVLSLFRG